MSSYNHLNELYQGGCVPWDQPEPPPEVPATLAGLPPGRALDLGSGYGRAALYMGGLGWQVDAVDYIPAAVAEAGERARRAGLAGRVRFHTVSVTRLGFLHPPYDFALDVGCAHSLTPAELRRYHRHLLRLLKPGAVYLLFAHLNPLEGGADERHWLDEDDLRRVFGRGFTLERVEYGQTQVNDQPAWRSAWFWFRRSAD